MRTLSRRRILSLLPGLAPLLAMPREDAPVVTNEDLVKAIQILREKQRQDVADLRQEQAAIQRGNIYVWQIFDKRLDVIEECLPKCGQGELKEDAKGEL